MVAADAARKSDVDGRGNLSDEGLSQFCEFFIQTALDQVAFMGSLLDLDGLEIRIAAYIQRRATLGEMDPTGALLLRDILVRGEVARGAEPASEEVRRVAERCFVHVNTVTYRLRRISELLAVDLGDPRVIFDLTLALRISDLIDTPTTAA